MSDITRTHLKAIDLVKQTIKLFVAGLTATFFQMASAQTIGSWDYEIKNDFYAGTTNESSNSFGQQCSPADKTCRYFVGLPSSCKVDVTYPALVNADNGAFTAQLLCVGKVGKYNLYRYVFKDFDKIDSAAKTSTRIAIAIPLENSEVAVLRFPLDGALTAITLMRNTADHASGK